MGTKARQSNHNRDDIVVSYVGPTHVDQFKSTNVVNHAKPNFILNHPPNSPEMGGNWTHFFQLSPFSEVCFWVCQSYHTQNLNKHVRVNVLVLNLNINLKPLTLAGDVGNIVLSIYSWSSPAYEAHHGCWKPGSNPIFISSMCQETSALIQKTTRWGPQCVDFSSCS